MQKSGGVFLQVMKHYVLIESQEPSFAPRQKSGNNLVPRLCLGTQCLDADEAEPRGSVVPGGAWDQGMGARCCEGVNAPLVMN